MSGTRLLAYRGIRPRLAARVFVAPSASIIGDVEIGAQSSVWFGCVLRGDVNVIRVGARSNIQDGTVVHVAKDTVGTFIGDDVTIGHLALLHACTVEDRAFIGMRATVMDECVVEAEGMLAAGALLTPGKRVGTRQLWAGTPARHVRNLGDEEIAHLARLGPRYVGLAADYLDGAEGGDSSGAA
jgi:carbonic anhydrase/acetyltransferase-like protein (isoleucine patch superfamily)